MYATLVVEHALTEDSVFHDLLAGDGVSQDDVQEISASKLTFATLFLAHDVVHGDEIHSSYSWTPDKILVAPHADKVFADVITRVNGKAHVDFEKIGEVQLSKKAEDTADIDFCF